MAINRILERQHSAYGVGRLTSKNVGGAAKAIEFGVRPGTLVLRVGVQTTTAFDGTLPTITVGDGTTVYANAVDAATAGAETTANAPKYYPTGGVITASIGAGTGNTVGEAVVFYEYVILGNGNAGVQE